MSMKESDIRNLADRYGTPFHVFDARRFDENFTDLQTAFQAIYPSFAIAYSFKTNYTPAICARVLRLGGIAEVVSGMEYRLAKKLGFPPDRILVNGPGKWDSMEEMLLDGALVMLDNAFEAELAEKIAAASDAPVRIGFRLNFEIGSGKNSRFGLDVLDPALPGLISRIRAGKNIRIEGLHFHLSGARSLEAWRTRAERMVQYAKELLEPGECRVLDLGSGMFGRMEQSLAEQFPQPIPDFAQYARAVASVFRENFADLPAAVRPLLVAEPGTTLVADTVSYVSQVLTTKVIRGRKIALLDGSTHQLGELCTKKALPIQVLPQDRTAERLSGAELTGYTCLEEDILYRSCPEPVGAGDLVWFGNDGSYSLVLKPPFIRPACAMLEWNGEGNSRVIKKPEPEENLFSTFVFD